MALGYDGKLYILASTIAGRFQTEMFGIQGDPTPGAERDDLRRQAARLRGDGAGGRAGGADAGASGVLVDEQFGGEHPARRRRAA